MAREIRAQPLRMARASILFKCRSDAISPAQALWNRLWRKCSAVAEKGMSLGGANFSVCISHIPAIAFQSMRSRGLSEAMNKPNSTPANSFYAFFACFKGLSINPSGSISIFMFSKNPAIML